LDHELAANKLFASIELQYVINQRDQGFCITKTLRSLKTETNPLRKVMCAALDAPSCMWNDSDSHLNQASHPVISTSHK
jgi:hypothetical protein